MCARKTVVAIPAQRRTARRVSSRLCNELGCRVAWRRLANWRCHWARLVVGFKLPPVMHLMGALHALRRWSKADQRSKEDRVQMLVDRVGESLERALKDRLGLPTEESAEDLGVLQEPVNSRRED